MEQLDIKKTLNFISKEIMEIPNITLSKLSSCLENTNDNVIYTIDNFLSEELCNEIIYNSETSGFDYLNFRQSYRLLAKDNNNHLTEYISNTINKILEELISFKWKEPTGFDTYNINWKQTSNVNDCIRINKYTKKSFGYHRDAPFTQSNLLRSNYTVLIYLNDNFTGGETVLNINKVYHDGLTVEQELNNQSESKLIQITPKKGRCVIFPHGILHKSEEVEGVKYVLRTDLISVGKWKKNKISSELLSRLSDLTKTLFRQAQLNELENRPSKELYEICLSLRLNPTNIKTYPQHLEKLLTINPNEKIVFTNLKFLGRNGLKYKFKYDNKIDNNFEIIRDCIFFSVLSLVSNIDKAHIAMFNNVLATSKIIEHIDSSDFVNAVGKYNLINFDLVPCDFKKKLVERIRVRAMKITNKRVFDLTHAIKEMTKDNYYHRYDNNESKFNLEGTNYKIIELSDFSNRYDVSVKSIFKKLFDIDIECLNIIDREIYKKKPLSILTTFHTMNSNIHIYKCCGKPKNINLKSAVCVFGTTFTYQMGDSIIKLYDLFFTDKTLTGKAIITTPVDYFNHASCCCERSCIPNSYYDIKKYLVVDYKINFINKTYLIAR